MLTKRIIPCLDVRNRKVTKGIKFQNNIDLGDPIEMAVAYSDGGCDELVFYDITASAQGRGRKGERKFPCRPQSRHHRPGCETFRLAVYCAWNGPGKS